MTTNPETPKLHVDSDWKAQAQAEKERLIQKEKSKAAPVKPGNGASSAQVQSGQGQGGQGQELPEPTFRNLMSMLASQALMGLGMMMDKETNRVVIDLEGSRFNIDLLDMLEQKSKGNLSAEEAAELKQVLAELRTRFVQIANLVARQMAAGAAGPAGTASVAAPPDLRATDQPGGPVILS